MSQKRGRAVVAASMLCLCLGVEAASSAKRFPIFRNRAGLYQPVVAPAGGTGFLVLGYSENRLAARRVEIDSGGAKLFPSVLLRPSEQGLWLTVEPDSRHETFLAVWNCRFASLCGVILDPYGRRLGEPFKVSKKASAVRAQVAHDWVRKRWIVMWKNYENWRGEWYRFRTLAEDGQPLGPERRLARAESFAYDPRSDTLLVAWNKPGPKVLARFLTSSGRRLGRKLVLAWGETSPPAVHWSTTQRRWLVTWVCRGNDVCGRFFGDSGASPDFSLRVKNNRGFSVYFTSIGHQPLNDQYLVSWRRRNHLQGGSEEIWAEFVHPDGSSPGRRVRVSHPRGFVPAEHDQFTACSPDRPLCLVVWSGARKPTNIGTARTIFGRFLGLKEDPAASAGVETAVPALFEEP